MAETIKKEKRILVRLTNNVRHGKETLQRGILVRGPEKVIKEWVDAGAAELFDEEQIKVLEI